MNDSAKARYICIEGTEGVGKTTQTQKIVDYLKSLGYKVLQTKEPGTPLSSLTMQLRGIMLDAQYEKEMSQEARELISQAIRSIHLKQVIVPALYEYDFIIQDRGILSGLAYGEACGNDIEWLKNLATQVVMPQFPEIADPYFLYDDVVYLRGNTEKGLALAKAAKQEFAAGDAMEMKGNDFMANVQTNMDRHSKRFNTSFIEVDNQDIEQVFSTILYRLNLRQRNDQ